MRRPLTESTGDIVLLTVVLALIHRYQQLVFQETAHALA